MAKSKSKPSPAVAAAQPAPALRVAALPASMASVRLDAALSGKVLDRNTLAETARGLASGSVTPQATLLTFAQNGGQALDDAAKAAQRAAAAQTLVSSALRNDLLRLKAGGAPPQPGKTDYVVRGQVTLANGEPAAGLAVEATAQNAAQSDVLGAAITDDKGAFQILVAAKDFAASGAKTQQIGISVGIEGEAPLHATDPVALFSAGQEAKVDVKLPESAGAAAAAAASRAKIDAEARLFRLDYAQAAAQLHQQQLGDALKAVQAGIAKLVDGLKSATAPVSGKPGA
jgi:hypothetical protein